MKIVHIPVWIGFGRYEEFLVKGPDNNNTRKYISWHLGHFLVIWKKQIKGSKLIGQAPDS